MSARSVNNILPEIVTWLEQPDPDRTLETLRRWDDAAWHTARRVVFMQGIAPYLHDKLSPSKIYAALPASFRDYLAQEYAMNAKRLERLHAELEAILRAANQAQIEVMPLKGSLLTTHYYSKPAVRPMSDLDLLIHPQDQNSMADILNRLGYACRSPLTGFAHHATYLLPGSRVVSWNSEHPDNPRPVEIHVNARRVLWANILTPDLTAELWEGAKPLDILGQRVLSPREGPMFAYLALHSLAHFLYNTGRLLHLLDLAYFAPRVPDIASLPYPNLVYPPVSLAARAMPSAFQNVDLSAIAAKTHPRIRRWSEQVSLDGRCGLYVDPTNRPHSAWQQRWERWRPTWLRMLLAYGDAPLAIAYFRYFSAVIGHLKGRIAPGSVEESVNSIGAG